jgi:hypothetical protein
MSQRVRHVALFRWKDGASVDPGAVADELRAIVAATDGAFDLVVGVGLGLSGPSGFDFGLTADFVDEAAYLAYRQSPDHQRLLAEVLVPASETISAIQLSLDS